MWLAYLICGHGRVEIGSKWSEIARLVQSSVQLWYMYAEQCTPYSIQCTVYTVYSVYLQFCLAVPQSLPSGHLTPLLTLQLHSICTWYSVYIVLLAYICTMYTVLTVWTEWTVQCSILPNHPRSNGPSLSPAIRRIWIKPGAVNDSAVYTAMLFTSACVAVQYKCSLCHGLWTQR